MTAHLSISRRELIAGGLMVAFARSAPARAATPEATGPSAIGGFVRISQEGGISLVMPSVEMGQGIYTAEAALLAEELDVRLDQMVVIAAPPDASLYAQPLFKAQMTGGSTSIRGFWTLLRQAGAAARSMLVAAAARNWGVHPDECSTKDGTILHSSTGRVLRYGEVAESAATLPIPEDPKLKSLADFKIIGLPKHRIDTPAKVNGSAVYGIDVAVDGMKTAAVAMSPVDGGKVKSVDETGARKIPSVIDVLRIDDAVAVVAEHYWAARAGVEALEIDWELGPNAKLSTASIRAELRSGCRRNTSFRFWPTRRWSRSIRLFTSDPTVATSGLALRRPWWLRSMRPGSRDFRSTRWPCTIISSEEDLGAGFRQIRSSRPFVSPNRSPIP
jgi:isoquinoline 1-oxidoreductase subunit beta